MRYPLPKSVSLVFGCAVLFEIAATGAGFNANQFTIDASGDNVTKSGALLTNLTGKGTTTAYGLSPSDTNGTYSFITPQMCGAVGDGTTYDTAALQLAIDSQYNSGAGSGKIILLPVATYRTRQLKYYENTRIIGLSRERSILSFEDTTSAVPGMVPFDEGNTNARSFSFTDFTFRLPSTNSSTNTAALRIKGPSYGKVEFCRFDLTDTNAPRTAIVIDGGGGSSSYYNELHQNQILNAQTGVLLKDAANANLILGNVFLSGVFGVIVTNSYGNRIAFNTFQDLTNGFGIWFTGSSYGNSAEGNWCERMMHGVYSDGTTHDNYVHGNKYSVIGGTEKRGWGGPKIYEQNIDESAINTFLEVGQFRQVKRLLPWLNTTWPVDTSSNYDNGIFAIPQDSALTNNSALIGEVRNTAGTRSFVPFLVPEGVETITAGNTTPDVYLKKFIRTANTSSTTITDFKNGRNGQVFTLFVNDSNTTITFGSSSPIRGANIKASYKCREGDVFQFIQDSGGVWRALSISPYLWGFTVSDSSGLQIRPTTGSSWDYAVLKADGSTAAVYMPTGTAKMLFQDAIAIGNGTEIRKVLSVSATLKFPSTAAQADSDLTLTLTGAAVGDVVSLGIPNSSVVSGGTFTAWVSAADTVTVRFSNYSSSAKDPASGTFRAMVTQF